MDLANRVRIRREQLGWTQDELAKRMGYKSRVSINKIENGRAVSQKIIVRLAEALDTTPAYLMGWEIEHENKEKPITNTDDGLRDDIQKFTAFLQGCSEEETKALFLMSRAYLATLREDASDPQAED